MHLGTKVFDVDEVLFSAFGAETNGNRLRLV